MIEPGDTAPDFDLPDQDGRPVRLSGLRGRPVVLYFYPKADTPGCTTQACGVRDHLPDYEDAGAVAATFIIDPDGTVAHVIPKVSPKTHDEQALAALARLRDAA